MAKRTPYNAAVTTVVDGRDTIAAAGTAEAVSSTSIPVLSIDVTAETDNTGIVCIGASTVVAALATRRGTPLVAGDTLTLNNVDLKNVFADVTVNGDGYTFTYVAGA